MHKIKALLSPLHHRGAEFIKVEIPKNSTAMNLIRSISGRKWSKTHQCWYVPKVSTAYKELQAKFDVEIKLPSGATQKPLPVKKQLEPKQKVENKQVIQPKFYSMSLSNGDIQKRVLGDKIILLPEKTTRFKAFIPFDKKGWISIIQEIPGRAWNAQESYWSLPYVKGSFLHLKRFIGMKNVQIGFVINPDIPEQFIFNASKNTPKGKYDYSLNKKQQDAITALVERLTLEKRSHRTIKAYKYHLKSLLIYYNKLSPDAIDKNHLERYLLHLIRKKKISTSTQNTVINAVKAYWERVLKRGKEWIDVPRPKKPKKLPNVLSTEEVRCLITSPRNLKHKLILMLIYSAGLRRGELLNLLVRDININRRAIHVKNSKGQKDRYVTLAESVIPFLVEYKKQYRPNRWLFEGQSGGQYSATSLQRIFRTAIENAKVNPYATLHTLRHSYATHCVESGHNLKSVQEALGHESLRTTEIYLHISSDALRKLRSPLDDLDLNA